MRDTTIQTHTRGVSPRDTDRPQAGTLVWFHPSRLGQLDLHANSQNQKVLNLEHLKAMWVAKKNSKNWKGV